eukprot:m.161269 g.161269  ORF g.161269 m.161269 type:complete len:889 (+) comp31222_c0_seq1:149-2815(+)
MASRRSSKRVAAQQEEEASDSGDEDLQLVDEPADETDLALAGDNLELGDEDDEDDSEDNEVAIDEDVDEVAESAESDDSEEHIEGLEEEADTESSDEDDDEDDENDDEDDDEDEEEEDEDDDATDIQDTTATASENNTPSSDASAANSTTTVSPVLTRSRLRSAKSTGTSEEGTVAASTKDNTTSATTTTTTKPKKTKTKATQEAIKTKLRTLESLPTFREVDEDEEYYRPANLPEPAPQKESWMTQSGQMEVRSSSSDESDDMHSRDQIGKIPAHWYDDEEHIGYDLDGKKIKKTGKAKDRLDRFLDKVDDPNYGRTIVDPITKKEIVLSQEDVDVIKRIQGGEFPDGNFDPYEDYINFYTDTPFIHPISNKPEPKSRFVPSKWEHKRVMKYVRAIRKGWLKPKVKDETPEFYDIWNQQDDTPGRRKAPPPIVAPKLTLPGHAESYNPPAEYVPDAEERQEWLDLDPQDRPRNFLPQKFTSLRHVPYYRKFLNERFARCLDLYLCPRTVKQRIHIDPESLIPKLPKPSELKPFPSKQSLCYEGHTSRVSCISIDPSGRWLLSGSDDGKAIFWEVTTGRRQFEITMPNKAEVRAVAWNPNSAITIAAITFESTVWLVNPQLGSIAAHNATDAMLHKEVESPIEADEQKKKIVDWTRATKAEYKTGLRFIVKQSKPIDALKWHNKGNYFSTVAPSGISDSVAIHSLLRRTSQYPFKKGRDVQTVAFHPSKPIFFVATKTHVRVYNLHTQALLKRLVTGSQHLSSISVHPKGDNIILGTYDRRLCWFDLDLSVKPYKTLRYHRLAIRSVQFHQRHPLFASASDDGTIHIFHGMVYNDLMQNPLIVPVKILRGHSREDKTGLGVMDCCFHPTQPWLFSAGADGTIRLYTDE